MALGTHEALKRAHELAVFGRFALERSLRIDDGSARNGKPDLREPDIVYTRDGRPTGLELARAGSAAFHEAIAAAGKNSVQAMWADDDTAYTLRNKLAREHAVAYPVELLLYRDGAPALPDPVLMDEIRHELTRGLGPFAAVWFLGDPLRRVSPAWPGGPASYGGPHP